MSYILDALRKSDLQRQRGAPPTLLAVQDSAVERKRPVILAYSLLAAVLVGAGMVVGWLRPWQSEQAAPVRPETVPPTVWVLATLATQLTLTSVTFLLTVPVPLATVQVWPEGWVNTVTR